MIEGMKRVLTFVVVSLMVLACGGRMSTEQQELGEEAKRDHVEVLYFHGKQRCATCVAIERETTAVIEGQFADAVKSGAVEFQVIDITKAENEAIADKYEITWSSLVIVKYKDGKEEAENLTAFAFANARSHPDEFRKTLTEKIEQSLK